MLSYRQIRIINYLKQEKEFITIKKLSNLFHLSERSIQYDLEDVEYYAKKLEAQVVRHKHYGVKLISSPAFERQLSDEQGIEKVLTPEERKEKILIIFFETLSPVSSNQLAQKLGVTRRTIVNDMKDVESWLVQHSLELTYVKNKGFFISGSEQKFRESYVEILIKHYHSYASSSQSQILEPKEIALIHRSIDSALNKENYSIVQTARDGLVFHIAITIHRVRNDFQISMPEQEQGKLQKKQEFRIAKQIQQNVEENFGLDFPSSEIGYITLHLLGAKQSGLNQDEEMQATDSLRDTLKVFIKHISGFMGEDLTSDPLLLKGLIIHLKPAIYRMQYQMRNENPLKKEIQDRYPNIIRAVNANLPSLENKFQVTFNDDESAYITMHIGSAMERRFEKTRYGLRIIIMCASGVGTSQLLKSKIENYYPELNVYDSFSIYDIGDDYFIQNKIDLVISTISTPDFSIPVIKVSPFLTKEDRRKLNEHLNMEREKAIESGLSVGPELNELLTPECVSWEVEASNWKKAIYLSTDLLNQKGVITQDYSKAIIEQFERNGPYMIIDKGIAFPHAKPSDGVELPGISFIKLKTPVYFGHSEYDPVSYVICLATTDEHIHLNALRQLTILLQDDSKMEQIKGGDKHTLLQLVDQVSQL